MSQAPTPPQPHFASPYRRPTSAPTAAQTIVTTDGARIAAFAYGQPPEDADTTPILMLHGNGEEHGIFGPTIDAATAEGHSVLALDSRAQGRSTRGTARLSYELMAADALAAMDHFGIASAHVAGFSDGAIVGLLFARDHPGRVASLLSIGANLTPDGVCEEDGWDMAATARAHRRWAAWAEAAGLAPTPRKIDPALLSPTPKEARITADLLQLMLDEPHIDPASLVGICCPVTVMVGENDCILPSQTHAIVGALRLGNSRQVRLVVVDGAEHTLPKHEPERVTQELLRLVSMG